MQTDEIIFNIEGSDKEAAFFALYAGLRMYYEQRKARDKDPKQFSIAAAEAYCMLEGLKSDHPKEYKEAETEFNEVYAGYPHFILANRN